MTNQARFERVAASLAEKLQTSGLRRQIPLKIEESDSDGWWAYIIAWGPRRPKISIWFDRALGEDECRFWFGFQSGQHQIVDKLVGELGDRFPHCQIGKSDWLEVSTNRYRLKQGAIERIKNNNGLVYERYRDWDWFDYFGLSELGIKYTSDEELVRGAWEFILDVIEYFEPNLGLNPKGTDYQSLVLARRGQGVFRGRVEQVWGNKCAVNGWKAPQVLRASHIKPWRDSTDDERLDGNNGLLLGATLDALFDRLLISFDEDGGIMISPKLAADEQKLLMLNGLQLTKRPTKEQEHYLKFHRREFQRRAASP